MKHKISLLLLLLLSLSLAEAQTTACRDIAIYNKYTKEGKRLVAEGKYVEALKFYDSAKDWCEEKKAEVDKLIVAMVKQINEERELARNNLALVQRERQSAINMIEALAGKQDNYYEYFYGLGKRAYDLGEYDEAVKNLILASESFDKPSAVDMSEILQKARECQKTQNKAYALIQEQQYEEAEVEIVKTLAINPNARKTILIANALNPAKYGLVKVRGGSFQMGSDVEDEEQPIHEVSLDDFSIGRYEVTNLAYAIFLNRYFSDSPFGGKGAVKEGTFQGKDMIYTHAWGLSQNEAGVWEVSEEGYDFYPIIYVTWYGANEFCSYYKGHLPSEAAWEYSARGGAKTKAYQYAGSKELDKVAWYDDNSLSSTHAVGLKQTNELGLYDMSGNVSEWCSDWYAKDYYSNSPRENPRGAENGAVRVLRGGSWLTGAVYCRVASRGLSRPVYRGGDDGFRFAF